MDFEEVRLLEKLFLFTAAFFASTALVFAKDKNRVDLDPLLIVPRNWQMTVGEFVETYTKAGVEQFQWLTANRARAKFATHLRGENDSELRAFSSKTTVSEAIVDFADGRVNLVTLSIFNRGDEGSIPVEDFRGRFEGAQQAMSAVFQVRPRSRRADPTDGLVTEGQSWYSRKKGFALLEYNENALDGSEREFLRLRLARPDARGNLARAISHSRGGAAVKLDDLADNVVTLDDGDVYIPDIPMVDQGAKGYCVVAAAQRVFEYLGVGVDMHQLAQISDADPETGTNIIEAALKVGKIDYRFKTRMDVLCLGPPGAVAEVELVDDGYYRKRDFGQRKFEKRIKSNIEDGLPLLWSLVVGLYPEDPPLQEQLQGGHMRIIVGFNEEENAILFSDSWGAGHELKRMDLDDAYMATTGLFTLRPTTR